MLHLQRLKGGDSAPLLHSGDTPPEHCVQLWGPQERPGLTGVNPEEGHQGLEQFPYEVKLRELELFNLEERRLWRDPTAPCST